MEEKWIYWSYEQLTQQQSDLEKDYMEYSSSTYPEAEKEIKDAILRERTFKNNMQESQKRIDDLKKNRDKLNNQMEEKEKFIETLNKNNTRMTEQEDKARKERNDKIELNNKELDKIVEDHERAELALQNESSKLCQIQSDLKRTAKEIDAVELKKTETLEEMRNIKVKINNIAAIIAGTEGSLDHKISELEQNVDTYASILKRVRDLKPVEPCVSDMLSVLAQDHFLYGLYGKGDKAVPANKVEARSQLQKTCRTLGFFHYLNELKRDKDMECYIYYKCKIDELARIRREFLDEEIRNERVTLPADPEENTAYCDCLKEKFQELEKTGESRCLKYSLKWYYYWCTHADPDDKRDCMITLQNQWEFPTFVAIESNRCAVSDPVRSSFLEEGTKIYQQYQLDCMHGKIEKFFEPTFKPDTTLPNSHVITSRLVCKDLDRVSPDARIKLFARLMEVNHRITSLMKEGLATDDTESKTAEELKISEEEMSLIERKIRQIMLMNSPDKMDSGSHALLLEKVIGDKRQALSQELLDLEQHIKKVKKEENREDMVQQLKSFVDTRKSFIRQQLKTLKVDQKKAAQATKIHKEIDDAASNIVKSAKEQLETRARAAAMRKFSTKKKGK